MSEKVHPLTVNELNVSASVKNSKSAKTSDQKQQPDALETLVMPGPTVPEQFRSLTDRKRW